MKQLVLIAIAMLFAVSAMAATTSNGTWEDPSLSALGAYLNQTHEYEQTSKYKAPMGYIADLWLIDEKVLTVPCKLGVSGQYDQKNGVFGAFVKADVNAAPALKSMAKSAMSFFGWK